MVLQFPYEHCGPAAKSRERTVWKTLGNRTHTVFAQLEVTGSGRYYTYSHTMDMVLSTLKDGTGSVYGSKAPPRGGGNFPPPTPPLWAVLSKGRYSHP